MDTTYHSTEPRIIKHVEGYKFLSFARNLSNKYGTQLLDTATNTVLDVLKTASKIIVDKAAVEEIMIPLEKSQEILNELRQVL